MKITTKHRIRYKCIEAPGEPVEMTIYRDVEGNYMTAAGDMVAYEDGVPSGWVGYMLCGTSEYYVGEIIPPPFEPHVGMVVENPKNPDSYLVCFRTGVMDNFDWIDREGEMERTSTVQNLIEKAGWEVVS